MLAPPLAASWKGEAFPEVVLLSAVGDTWPGPEEDEALSAAPLMEVEAEVASSVCALPASPTVVTWAGSPETADPLAETSPT